MTVLHAIALGMFGVAALGLYLAIGVLFAKLVYTIESREDAGERFMETNRHIACAVLFWPFWLVMTAFLTLIYGGIRFIEARFWSRIGSFFAEMVKR